MRDFKYSAVSLRSRGFTLVEMTIVLFIIGLLIAGLIAPVQVQLEARDRRRTLDTIENIVEALYGYAISNRRLPCPDTDGDGIPNPSYDGTLANAVCDEGGEGFVPWSELAVNAGDAWGNRFRYRVTSTDFTWPSQDMACNGSTQNEYDLCTTGSIQINTRGDNPGGSVEGKFLITPTPTAIANVAAVVLSHGRNGYGSTSVGGVARPVVPVTNGDEAENVNGDNVFMDRGYTQEQGGCADDMNEGPPLCEFDDIVLPVSRTVLNSRMVAAGQLP